MKDQTHWKATCREHAAWESPATSDPTMSNLRSALAPAFSQFSRPFRISTMAAEGETETTPGLVDMKAAVKQCRTVGHVLEDKCRTPYPQLHTEYTDAYRCHKCCTESTMQNHVMNDLCILSCLTAPSRQQQPGDCQEEHQLLYELREGFLHRSCGQGRQDT